MGHAHCSSLKDGTVHICGDFKITLNLVCELEQYPLPLIEDILAQLGGGERYSILDFRDAYNQMPLDEETRKIGRDKHPQGPFASTASRLGLLWHRQYFKGGFNPAGLAKGAGVSR